MIKQKLALGCGCPVALDTQKQTQQTTQNIQKQAVQQKGKTTKVKKNKLDTLEKIGIVVAILAGLPILMLILYSFLFTDIFDVNNKNTTNITSSTNTISLSDYDIEVDINEFTEDYYKNELTANEKYMNKRIKITGTLNNTDVDDSIILNLGTTCYLKSDKHYDVACNFKEGDTDKLSNYSRGQKITIIRNRRHIKRQLSKKCSLFKKMHSLLNYKPHLGLYFFI